MSELKRLSSGLILLLIMTLLGCGNKEPSVISPKISTKYYMVKAPSVKDETLLLEYSKSQNKKLASEAKCLLAGYYVKKGEYQKSNNIFSASDNKLFESEEMGLQLSYWRIINNIENDVPVNTADVDRLERINTKQTNTFKKDLCNRYMNSTELGFCATAVMGSTETESLDNVSVGSDDNMTASAFSQISEDEKIVVKQSPLTEGMVKGLVFSFKENELNFEISQTEPETEGVVVIDPKTRQIRYKGEVLDFSTSLEKDAEVIFNHVWNKNPDMVVIGINDRSIAPGVQLKNSLEEMGIPAIILNFEVPDFRKNLNVIYEEYSENYIYFVGIGSETSMTEFVPIVKFMSETPEAVEICVITDIFSDLYFSEQFRSYFKTVEVMTYIEVNGNYWSKKFQNGFKYFYDEDPDSSAFIGFDMALKLKTYIDASTKEDYVSNIESFTNEKADRELKIYEIIDYNKVKRVQ